MTSAITITLTEFQDKYDTDILLLRLIIRNWSVDEQPTPSAGQQPTLPYHPDTSKKLDERWNQADLSYFDPYLNEVVYRKGELIILGKDIYYWNMSFICSKNSKPDNI